ncbi:MAG: DUF3592 domain-containing protein [Planctomycetota bacterium]|jgi:hypothetical protein
MQSETEIAKLKDVKNTGVIVIFVAALFSLFLGFVLAIPSVIWPIIKGRQVANWSKQNCTILKKEVKTHNVTGDGPGVAYSVDIQYSYDYQGVNYLSNKYDFQDEFYKQYYDDYKTARALVNSYDSNITQICYVNPQEPSEAVLSTKVDKPFKKAFFSMIGISIGFAMLGLCIGEKRRMKGIERGLLPDQSFPKTYSSTRVRCVYFMLFLLGGLAFLTLTFLLGNNEPSKTKYLIGKALYGGFAIALLFWAMKCFFKLIVLPVKITFNSANLRIGETLEVNWKVGPKAEKILGLVIGIRCEATVRDKDTNKFVYKILHRDYKRIVSGSSSIKTGQATFPIPNSYEIITAVKAATCRWVFIFNARVDRYPDINDEYDFEVYAE